MQLEVGSIVEGKVTGITKFGAFVELAEGKSGMVHISEVANVFVSEISQFLTEGQTVKAKIINISDEGKISLSIKKATPKPTVNREQRAPRPPRDKNDGAAPRPVSRPKPQPKPKAPIFTGDPNVDWTPVKSGNAAFEDMLQKFKQTSEEKTSGMKKGQSNRRGNSRKK
jgi:S1 RNA binding domain protein